MGRTGPRGATFVGFLFLLVGAFLILLGATRLFDLGAIENYVSGISSQDIEIIQRIGATGSYMLILYGIIAFALSIGFFQQQEWAAGGGFVLILISLVSTGFIAWEQYSLLGLAATSTIVSIVACLVMALILVYLIVARGWK